MNHSQNSLQKRQKMLQMKADAGLVSEKFAQVKAITIKMTYYQRSIHNAEDKLLMIRTVNISPTSSAIFKMPCPEKECEKGFDFEPILKPLIKARKKRESGTLVCGGKGPNLMDKHASIHYQIEIEFLPASRH